MYVQVHIILYRFYDKNFARETTILIGAGAEITDVTRCTCTGHLLDTPRAGALGPGRPFMISICP